MGLGYIALGILFLINPNIHVLDFLPDFIGVILLYRGMFQMSFSSEKWKDARSALWKLGIITGVRVLSFFFVPGASDSFKLLLTFSFGVLEIIYTIPAVLSAFEGSYDLGRRYDAQSVYGKKTTKKGRTVETAEGLKRFTLFFFLLKTVLNVLPELSALQITHDLSPEATGTLLFADFKPLFYLFSGTLTSVLGVIWLVRMLGHIRAMRQDAALTVGVASFYKSEIEGDAGVSASLRMKNVLLLFVLAVSLGFPLQFDGICVLPMAVFAFVLSLAICYLARYDRLANYGYLLSTLAAVFSIVSLLLQIPYFAEYDVESARYVVAASKLYDRICMLGPIEYIFAGIAYVYFVIILLRVLKKHAALVGGLTQHAQYNGDARAAEILRYVRGRIILSAIVGFLYFGLRAVSYEANLHFAAFWLIPMAVYVLFIGTVIYAVSGIRDVIYDRLENKY